MIIENITDQPKKGSFHFKMDEIVHDWKKMSSQWTDRLATLRQGFLVLVSFILLLDVVASPQLRNDAFQPSDLLVVSVLAGVVCDQFHTGRIPAKNKIVQ